MKADYHVAVMVDEVLDGLLIDTKGIYVDCTLGGGGHFGRLLAGLEPEGMLLGLDRDREAVELNLAKFADEPRARIAQARFSELKAACGRWGVFPGSVTGVLFDLGVSSHQIDSGRRGFTFASGHALDMRMNQGEGSTAAELLQEWDEAELARIFWRNGDISQSRRLASAIKTRLAQGAAPDSGLLRAAVEEAAGGSPEKRNQMLARVFQAIRMEVNLELPEVEAGLSQALEMLKPGGRMAVLSYHSGEDRLVKEFMAGNERECICPPGLPVCNCGGDRRRLKRIQRKPRLPAGNEIAANSRARSAKLRVAEKV